MFKKQIDAGRFVANLRCDYQKNFHTVLINSEYYIHKNVSLGTGTRVSINQSIGKNTTLLLVQSGLTILKDIKVIVGTEFVFINTGWAFTSEIGFVFSPSKSFCKSKRPKNGIGRGSIKCPEF
jgi:hypothetical protein